MPTKAKRRPTQKPDRTRVSVETTNLRCEIQRTFAQRAPFAAKTVLDTFDKITTGETRLSKISADRLKIKLVRESAQALARVLNAGTAVEVYPMLENAANNERVLAEVRRDLQAACERVVLQASLKNTEKIEIMRGMLTTRYLDARLKKFFMGTEVKTPAGAVFQGKGFRSMGQEAIYAAGIRLQRLSSAKAVSRDGGNRTNDYAGDYVAPMIRDLGLALAMGVTPYDVMAAQMGKVGKPTRGKDLHIGDMSCGVLPPAAPIALSVGNAVGLGLALAGTGRVAVNCNGEGGTSAGEWHEAINFAAVRKLPVVFVVQNNQTALSTRTHEQFACATLANKGIGYGIRSITIDGTNPEAVFAAVTEAAEACRRGEGPVLVELLAMRMCGHAHHDDMLYFGHEPDQYLTYPDISANGYIDLTKYAYWREKDPVSSYGQKLIRDGVLTKNTYHKIVSEVEAEIESAARKVIAAPWPDASVANEPVFTDGNEHHAIEHLSHRETPFPARTTWSTSEPAGVEFDPKGNTFWQAIVEALAEEMRRDQNVFILGQDVGGSYGNAFVILKSLLDEFRDRLMNTPLSESAIIGAATGAALLGKRPVAEIQFNDFVASGFNQLVNNTAKLYSRLQHPVPLTIRLPWGGLRNAGPYHSQNTEPWFYRTPGLKIVCPSTPLEAKGLLKAAIRDDNPVLFYEHIALYRAANIKQSLPGEQDDLVLPIGKAHLKRDGSDLTMITYGAYVHRCMEAAEQLQEQEDISCRVLDLRSLQPMDKDAILACVQDTNRVLIVNEDSKTGSIGQSVASIIAEEAFEYLDAPVRVLGALDTPVPYSPPLEEAFLVSTEQIREAAKLLARF